MRLILRVQVAILELIRVWWRPVSCVGIAGGAVNYGIVGPLYGLIVLKQVPSDGAGFAAVIAAAAAAFAVREVGKKWGTAQ